MEIPPPDTVHGPVSIWFCETQKAAEALAAELRKKHCDSKTVPPPAYSPACEKYVVTAVDT
jgi:hypothetical protein